jgi:hypothetical protein
MRIALGAFFVALAALCQTPAPAFEVASIKPSDGRMGLDIKIYPTRFASVCNTRQLIEAAYSVDRWQISGGPAWLDSDLFAIEATTGEDLSADTDRVVAAGRPAPRKMMLMLQTWSRAADATGYDTLVCRSGPGKNRSVGCRSFESHDDYYGP